MVREVNIRRRFPVRLIYFVPRAVWWVVFCCSEFEFFEELRYFVASFSKIITPYPESVRTMNCWRVLCVNGFCYKPHFRSCESFRFFHKKCLILKHGHFILFYNLVKRKLYFYSNICLFRSLILFAIIKLFSWPYRFFQSLIFSLNTSVFIHLASTIYSSHSWTIRKSAL